MARRVIQQLIDDIDGKPADESVTFSLDGVQ
ncbi:histone-like nucleoid-structuring protein Lsr2 [Dactylosporangium sp. NPDC050688]